MKNIFKNVMDLLTLATPPTAPPGPPRLEACNVDLPIEARRCLLLADTIDKIYDVTDLDGEEFYEARRREKNVYDQGTFGSQDECGTTACAMGWAGILLAPEMGFTFEPGREIFRRLDGDPTEKNGFQLAEEAFGMTEAESLRTFGNFDDHGRSEVSAALREHAAKLVKELNQ